MEKVKIRNGILKKVIRVKENIDRHVYGKYAEMSTGYIVNYIWWLNKYHKAPQKIIDDLTEYMIALYNADDKALQKFANYDVVKEWRICGGKI